MKYATFPGRTPFTQETTPLSSLAPATGASAKFGGCDPGSMFGGPATGASAKFGGSAAGSMFLVARPLVLVLVLTAAVVGRLVVHGILVVVPHLVGLEEDALVEP